MIRFNTQLRPSGHVIVSDPEDGIIESGTLQCVHCYFTWQMKPGSGNVRGHCMRCNGPICGRKCGGKCVPKEQRLDNLNTGRPIDYVPIVANVPRLWTPGT